MTPNRPAAPPPMSFFSASRPRGGSETVRLELGGLHLTLEDLGAGLAKGFLDRYAPYAVPGTDAKDTVPGAVPGTDAKDTVPGAVPGTGANDAVPGASHAVSGANDAIRISVSLEDRDYFIEPPPSPETNPVLLACDGERIRYLGYRLAGWFDVRGGRGEIVLARGDYEPDGRAIENYVRACVAWQAASRGGALVHAASAVWKDRAYLFYGPSGAGKSTLSSCNSRARVVSDDLSLVLPREDGGLDLVGSPFRGTYTDGPPVVGRFPLAAGFRIVKDRAAQVRTVPRVRVFAELIANLPFVVDAFPARPDLFARFERTFADLPLYHLHFKKDDSYWDAIATAGV